MVRAADGIHVQTRLCGRVCVRPEDDTLIVKPSDAHILHLCGHHLLIRGEVDAKTSATCSALLIAGVPLMGETGAVDGLEGLEGRYSEAGLSLVHGREQALLVDEFGEGVVGIDDGELDGLVLRHDERGEGGVCGGGDVVRGKR